MISVYTDAGESKIIEAQKGGYYAYYNGTEFYGPIREDIFCAAIDLIEIIWLYEGNETANYAYGMLREKFLELGYLDDLDDDNDDDDSE